MSKNPVQQTYWTHGQELGSYLVRFRWDPDEESRVYWIDFEVHEVTTTDMDGNPSFMVGLELNEGLTENPDEALPTVQGFVKWDGCTQIWFSDESPMIHADCQEDLTCLFSCLTEIREKALDVMGTREDYF